MLFGISKSVPSHTLPHTLYLFFWEVAYFPWDRCVTADCNIARKQIKMLEVQNLKQSQICEK